MHHPTDRVAHTTAFVTPVVEHWLERDLHFRDKVVFKDIYIVCLMNLIRSTF